MSQKHKQDWWLSWADSEGFNGAVVVEAHSFLEAVSTAIVLRIRPPKGGQVVGVPIEEGKIDPKDRNRLLSKEEAEKYA